MKEGRKLEYPEKTPGDEQPEDSSPKRDSNPESRHANRYTTRRPIP